MSQRALRRHHRQRMIDKWYRQQRPDRAESGSDHQTQWQYRAARIYARTRKPCACRMCRNPRRDDGNSRNAWTRQEVLAQLRARDD